MVASSTKLTLPLPSVEIAGVSWCPFKGGVFMHFVLPSKAVFRRSETFGLITAIRMSELHGISIHSDDSGALMDLSILIFFTLDFLKVRDPE